MWRTERPVSLSFTLGVNGWSWTYIRVIVSTNLIDELEVVFCQAYSKYENRLPCWWLSVMQSKWIDQFIILEKSTRKCIRTETVWISWNAFGFLFESHLVLSEQNLNWGFTSHFLVGYAVIKSSYCLQSNPCSQKLKVQFSVKHDEYFTPYEKP